MKISTDQTNQICKSIQASYVEIVESIQTLWSGYGHILRLETDNPDLPTVILKFVDLTAKAEQNSHSISHKRKLKSYKVETEWYQSFAPDCPQESRVARCYGNHASKDQMMIILEDLDASGYPLRCRSIGWEEAKICISWLANFHATFLQIKPEGLWSTGTYWHLATRPDELKALDDPMLKKAAGKIDQKLNSCCYKTIVHGDAKLANFCFSNDRRSVAAVDFQYVGGGCGMKDLAYFVGSCFDESLCERMESEILDYYLQELKTALMCRDVFNSESRDTESNPDPQYSDKEASTSAPGCGELDQSAIDFSDLESEWREMYHFAWVDFHRFIKGWSPGHWKINSYSERVSRDLIERL